jgi:sugar phosphate isomerase/epimerase
MVDFYHLLVDGQSLEAVQKAGPMLAHAHTAGQNRRPPGVPGAGDLEQVAFLRTLHGAGYDGRLSVEARFEDFVGEATVALAFLRDSWGKVTSG